MMELLNKAGECKFVPQCTYPLTGVRCVGRVYTDLATLEILESGVRCLSRVEGLEHAQLENLIGMELGPLGPVMQNFVHTGMPSRVVFGVGSLQSLEREILLLGAKRALVLSTPEQEGQALQVAELLGEHFAGVFPKAVMHVPVEVAREARDVAARLGADCAVAIGGGSTTGLGKAIALETGLPILAIPTTYAGSEMTTIYGLTQAGEKKTGRNPKVLPRTVIYDPALTLSLPVGLSVTSGINAIAHSAEALYAPDGSPVISLMAEEGIRALAKALPGVRRAPSDLDARSDALYGAWLCGSALAGAGMSLHHKLCHTLGGSFNLPHAEVHTVVLPHAIAFNASAAPDAMTRIARALGSVSAAKGLYDLALENGAPVALKDIGMKESDLDHAADLAVKNAYWNPRPVETASRGAIRDLLQRAYEGVAPLEE